MSDSRSSGVYNMGSGQSCPQLSVNRDTDASNNGRVMQDLSGERSSMDGSKVHNGDIGSLYIYIYNEDQAFTEGWPSLRTESDTLQQSAGLHFQNNL